MELDKSKKYGIVGASLFIILSLIGVAVWRNWLKIPSVLTSDVGIVSMGFVFLIGVTIFVIRKMGDTGGKFQPWNTADRKTLKQLNDREAFELLRYRLLFHHNIRIDEWYDRGADHVGTPGEEEPIRLYKIVFDRMNEAEKVAVYIDLEQEMQLDPDSRESLAEAAKEIENIRIIRSSLFSDFETQVENAREQLGKNLYKQFGNIQHFEYQDGDLVAKRELPPPVPGQNNINSSQNRVEQAENADDNGGD